MMSDGSSVDRAVFTILLVLGIVVLAYRAQTVFAVLRQGWPVAVFLLYCFISVAWSDFPDIAFKRLIREAGNWVMVLILWTDREPITAVMRLIARTAYVLIPLSVLFIRYYSIGRGYDAWTGAPIYIGVTDNKNTLGMVSVLLGLASVWHLLRLFSKNGRRTRNRMRQVTVHVTIIALSIHLLIKAGSVTALLCACLTTVVLWSLLNRVFTRSRTAVHLFVLGIVAIPVLEVFSTPNPELFQAVGRSSTLTDRTVIWAWAIKLVPNDWFGAGYSSFWLGSRLDTMVTNVTHNWIPNQAHNGYLEVFINLGWVGVGLLCVVLVRGYYGVITAWRQKQTASDLMLAYLLIGVISNISEASFFRNLNAAWLFTLLAIVTPAVRSNQSRVTGGRQEAPQLPESPGESIAGEGLRWFVAATPRDGGKAVGLCLTGGSCAAAEQIYRRIGS
jgi:O-antigen ligase